MILDACLPPLGVDSFPDFSNVIDITHVNAYNLSKASDFELLQRIINMFRKSSSDSIWVFITRDRRFKFDSGWFVLADGLIDFHLVIIQDFLKGRVSPIYIAHADRDTLRRYLYFIIENIIFDTL